MIITENEELRIKMLIFGIISEYNPLHNGHIYQINRIKKEYPDSFIVAFTSGSFVQRGEPSFIFKHFKAKLAVENGIDLLIEMPTIISLQSANFFAFYSAQMLNKLNILTHLCFGVEDMDKKSLNSLISFEQDNKELLDKTIKTFLDKGFSYKKSYELSLDEAGYSNTEKYFLPNNTLAILYTKALKELNSDIDIFPINRNDKGYHNLNISDEMFQSASALRNAYTNGHDIDKYIPFHIEENKEQLGRVNLDDYSSIFYYKAFVLDESGNDIAGYENGLLNLLKKNYTNSLIEAVELSHNKRYSRSRLKRFLLNFILDIKAVDVFNLKYMNYIRPLKFNKKGAFLLKKIKENSDINIINKLSDLNNLDDVNKRFISIDMNAFKLYNINHKRYNTLDYTENPYIE